MRPTLAELVCADQQQTAFVFLWKFVSACAISRSSRCLVQVCVVSPMAVG